LRVLENRCVFCKIIDGEVPALKVYEDGKALAFLDIHPSAPGHTLIIPKAHVAKVEDLSDEDAKALFMVLHRIVGKIQEAVDAPSSTIGINNGKESGQEIPHVHIHVIPRSRGDKGGIIQGVSRIHKRIEKDDMEKIAERIRGRLSII
jgi:histidine triad (HIT) family protein